MLTLLLAAALLVGYLTGRVRPARAASDWAAWQTRPRGIRYAAVYAIRSAENLGWLIGHPVQGWHAWQTRNAPPPPRSPALVLRANPWPPQQGDPE
ncbi:hypothetical protein [Streptomyces goshikiensis]|uniref:hypothetical protein n=1 Tax=Streptomyces goshikiensis TaxID=1942 RepID=UPI003674976E